MKRYVQLFTALFFILVFASCDNMSRFAIDEKPKAKIDARLLGRWHVKGSMDEYTLTRHNDNEYWILTKGKKNDDLDKNPAFLSFIGDEMFLNVYGEQDSQSGYLLFKVININTVKNVVTIAEVNDTTLKYLNNSDEVRERVTKNVDNPLFYSDTTYFFRIR